MNVKPRRDMTGFNWDTMETERNGDFRLIYAPEPGTLIVECEITHPPSRVGGTCYLWLDAQDVTDMLKATRTEAIRARSIPMEPQ